MAQTLTQVRKKPQEFYFFLSKLNHYSKQTGFRLESKNQIKSQINYRNSAIKSKSKTIGCIIYCSYFNRHSTYNDAFTKKIPKTQSPQKICIPILLQISTVKFLAGWKISTCQGLFRLLMNIINRGCLVITKLLLVKL